MLVDMAKVELIGPLREFDSVLDYIYNAGVLHIEDLTKKFKSDFQIKRMRIDSRQEKLKEECEANLGRVNGFITALKFTAEKRRASAERAREFWSLGPEELNAAAVRLIASIEAEAQELSLKQHELEQEATVLAKYEAMFKKMVSILRELVALEGFDTIMLLMDKNDADLLSLLEEELAQITREQCQLISATIDSATMGVVIVYNHRFAASVRSFLWDKHVNEVRLPEQFADLPYEQAVAKMSERGLQIPKELAEISARLDVLKEEHGDELVGLSAAIAGYLEGIGIREQFGTTDFMFIVQGWLPRKSLPELTTGLEETFGSRVLITEMAVSREERESTPIKYSNRLGIRSFEPIVRMFGTPKYGQVDPTPFVALSFPLFFGVILGDMGYALVVLGFAFWLKRRFKDIELVRHLMVILTMAGISSFIFGFAYGEFFGDVPHRLHIIKETHFAGILFPVDRQGDAMMMTLFFAIALGGAHILIGLIIGIVNAYRDGSHKHAVEKFGLLVMLLGVIALGIGSIPDTSLPFKSPGIGLLVLSLPLLLYGGGLLGILEILGTLGNVMSYARIMALGLVSVVLASLANKAGASFGDQIWLGVIVAAFIHVINIIIHVFTPSIHALRLNFVEFYGKFYEPGGREYAPLRRGEIE